MGVSRSRSEIPALRLVHMGAAQQPREADARLARGDVSER